MSAPFLRDALRSQQREIFTLEISRKEDFLLKGKKELSVWEVKNLNLAVASGTYVSHGVFLNLLQKGLHTDLKWKLFHT